MNIALLSSSAAVDYRWRLVGSKPEAYPQPSFWSKIDDGSSESPFLYISGTGNGTYQVALGNLFRSGVTDYRNRKCRLSVYIPAAPEGIARMLAIRYLEQRAELGNELSRCLHEDPSEKDFGYTVDSKRLERVITESIAPAVTIILDKGFEFTYSDEHSSSSTQNILSSLRHQAFSPTVEGALILLCKLPDEVFLNTAIETACYILHGYHKITSPREPLPRKPLPRKPSFLFSIVVGVAVLFVLVILFSPSPNSKKKPR